MTTLKGICPSRTLIIAYPQNRSVYLKYKIPPQHLQPVATANGEVVAHARLSPFTCMAVLSTAKQVCSAVLRCHGCVAGAVGQWG